MRGYFIPPPNKNVQMWDHFFPLLFPKDSESLKILDIWLREVGAKRPLNGTSKVNRQTDTQTDIWTNRLIESIGPEGRCFENPAYGRDWISRSVRIVAPIQKVQKRSKKLFRNLNQVLRVMWHVSCVTCQVSCVIIFKASALWADAFYKSKCPYVCLCVCVSVCLSVHFWGTV